jgi:hypothetical protein
VVKAALYSTDQKLHTAGLKALEIVGSPGRALAEEYLKSSKASSVDSQISVATTLLKIDPQNPDILPVLMRPFGKEFQFAKGGFIRVRAWNAAHALVAMGAAAQEAVPILTGIVRAGKDDYQEAAIFALDGLDREW